MEFKQRDRTTYEKASIPSTKKQHVKTELTKSFDKNLNRKNSDNSIALPTKGKRIACSFDIVSCVRKINVLSDDGLKKYQIFNE